jgi:hypothetical protein
MRLPAFLQQVVDFLQQRQIYFQAPGSKEPTAIRELSLTRDRTVKVLFANGMSLVVKGMKAVRDTITLPFDVMIQGLSRLLPAERRAEGPRPIVLKLFSLFSVFSLLGLFSFVKLL